MKASVRIHQTWCTWTSRSTHLGKQFGQIPRSVFSGLFRTHLSCALNKCQSTLQAMHVKNIWRIASQETAFRNHWGERRYYSAGLEPRISVALQYCNSSQSPRNRLKRPQLFLRATQHLPEVFFVIPNFNSAGFVRGVQGNCTIFTEGEMINRNMMNVLSSIADTHLES